MTLSVVALDHLVLTVANIDRTVALYAGGLGMLAERYQDSDGGERVALRFGAQKINLHLAGAEFEPKALMALPGSADLCFLTEAALLDWQARFAFLGIAVEEGPVERTGAVGRTISIYVRDPDGNLIEVAHRG